MECLIKIPSVTVRAGFLFADDAVARYNNVYGLNILIASGIKRINYD